MSFFKQFLPVKLLAVFDLRWPSGRDSNKGRPFCSLSYRIKGDVTFWHDDALLHVESGEIIFLPRDYKYGFEAATDEHVIAVHFEILDRSFVPEGMEQMAPVNPAAIEKLFLSIHSLWHDRRLGCEYAATAEFCRLLSELQRQRVELGKPATADRFGLACEHMFKNFTDPTLTVTALADMAGISTAYFRRIFKETYGSAPIQYLTGLRTDYAAELLRSGYFSVERVAEMAGFNDSKYFSVVMKSRFGVPPSKLK